MRGGGVGGHGGPGRAVGRIGKGRLGAGAGLHHDLPPGGDQFLGHVGHECDAALSGSCLGGDGQFHGGCLAAASCRSGIRRADAGCTPSTNRAPQAGPGSDKAAR